MAKTKITKKEALDKFEKEEAVSKKKAVLKQVSKLLFGYRVLYCFMTRAMSRFCSRRLMDSRWS